MPDSLGVVDASVIAALLFGEPRAEDAAERIGGTRLISPTLLRYEVSSVCLKKIKLHPRQRKELLQALSLVDRLNIRELAVAHDDVVALATQVKLTTYDASYLWLARNLDAELITFDEKLQRAWNRLAV